MRFLVFLLILTLSSSWSEANEYPSKTYLKGRIPKDDKRYSTMLHALELLEQRQCKTIVETGTFRNAHRGKKAFLCAGAKILLSLRTLFAVVCEIRTRP
jgi:hypothetical protein